MSKNIKLNGQEYNDISTVQLPTTNGEIAFFKDMDEISSTNGIAEIATGEFSVTGTVAEFNIRHGMSVAPDVICVIPKYWYDTVDNNCVILAASKFGSATGGRRAIEGSTSHFQGGIASEEKEWSNEIKITTSALAKFRPTYTDAEGNTGTQVYLWVAVKFAE